MAALQLPYLLYAHRVGHVLAEISKVFLRREYQQTDTIIHSWNKAGLKYLVFIADGLKLLKRLKKIVYTPAH